jgi:hypothetical protein
MAEKMESSGAGAGFLAKMMRSVSRAVGRFGLTAASYRPEKHYMRGAGPKSRRIATDSEHAPNAT